MSFDWSSKKVYVAGHNGLVGSGLVRALKRAGTEIVHAVAVAAPALAQLTAKTLTNQPLDRPELVSATASVAATTILNPKSQRMTSFFPSQASWMCSKITRSFARAATFRLQTMFTFHSVR